MKNGIEHLRDHLFEMLEQVKDKEASVDMERLRMGVDIANSVIASAKVEVDLLKATGCMADSDFFRNRNQPALPNGTKPHALDGKAR